MSDAALKADGGVRVARGGKRVDEDGGGLSSEEALKIANDTIARQSKTITAVTERAADADVAVANTVLGRLADREQAITNALSAANLAASSAEAAWRNARANGDIDAEAEAMKTWQRAGGEVERWTNEDVKFKAEKPRLEEAAKARATAANGSNPDWDTAAQAWITAHPRFNTDAQYKQDALDADTAAKARGFPGGSPENLAYIENTLSRLYKDHGTVTQDRQHQRQSRQSTSSDAAPPSNEGASDGFASHGVRVVRNSDGTRRVEGTAPAEWVDGAKWTGMNLADYCLSMLDAEEEAKVNSSKIVRFGDGVIYRG